MNPKDLLTTFKTAPWRSADDVERFVASAGEVAAAEIAKLLELIVGRSGPVDADKHALRCHAFLKLASGINDRALFAPYVRALKNADPTARGVLLQLLPKVNNVSEHATLIALLRAPDASLRQAAAKVLPAVGGKTVFDSLSEMVKEPAFPGRNEAMDVVMAMAPQHAIPLLHERAAERLGPGEGEGAAAPRRAALHGARPGERAEGSDGRARRPERERRDRGDRGRSRRSAPRTTTSSWSGRCWTPRTRPS